MFPSSGIRLLIVASCCLLCQVLVKETVGPFPGLRGLTSDIQLHLTILLLSFLKKKLTLIQSTGMALFQKYISVTSQLIGLAFTTLWTWMLVLEGKKKLIWAFMPDSWIIPEVMTISFKFSVLLLDPCEVFCPLFPEYCLTISWFMSWLLMSRVKILNPVLIIPSGIALLVEVRNILLFNHFQQSIFTNLGFNFLKCLSDSVAGWSLLAINAF